MTVAPSTKREEVMAKNQEIAWEGSDAYGYTGSINGLRLYKICAELYPPRAPFQRKAEYLYLARRLNVSHYEGFGETSHTADEAKTLCEIDYAYDGGRAALQKTLGRALLIVEALGFTVFKSGVPERKGRVSKPTLAEALTIVKTAGYRVSKLKAPKRKGPGPSIACEFGDGTRVRMSVACSTGAPDWERGRRLARQAWASRHKVPLDLDSVELAKIAPVITSARFERADGTLLAARASGGAI